MDDETLGDLAGCARISSCRAVQHWPERVDSGKWLRCVLLGSMSQLQTKKWVTYNLRMKSMLLILAMAD